MKKISSVLIAITLMLNCISIAFAADKQTTSPVSSEQPFSADVLDVWGTWESERSIANTKVVYDFAGNEYTVVECTPTGYIIFNNASATVLESAENSQSPYLGVSGDLYYAGPTHYYSYNNNQYTHTILGTVMSDSEASLRRDICREAQIALNLNAEVQIENSPISDDIVPLASSGYTYIGDNRDFFEQMDEKDEMGYWSTGGGVCGYVAAGIVLLYYDNFHNDEFIDDSEYNLTSSDYGYYFTDGSLTEYLYKEIGVNTLKYGTSLNASKVANVLRTYLSNDRGITAKTWTVNTPAKSDVVAQLKLNRPVIYVDRWNLPSRGGNGTTDHDIVVYGYNSSNKLIAHFGWGGYSHVEATSDALALFISSACSITSYS